MRVLATLVLLAVCGCGDDGGRMDAALDSSGPDVIAADVSGDSSVDSGAGDSASTDVGNSDGQADASSDDVPTVSSLSFFVTSSGSESGGDLGGLAGADARCQELATAAGAGDREWVAYLSALGPPEVHARNRIGLGPWENARGEMVAAEVGSLHENGIAPALMTDENGGILDEEIPGAEHDILTGSQEDGTLFAGRTCADWTSSDAADSARVGHHDWSIIPDPRTPDQNWNSVHNTGCDAAAMRRNLGSGRWYCFAAD